MADEDDSGSKNLPTIREALSDYFGVQLPGLPAMPQTIKNADKAIGQIFLALGGNLSERIKGNTGKIKTTGQIELDDIVRNAEERRKLENRAVITKAAIENLNEDPGAADASGDIEDDWLNTFARISEDKSSADLQKLFGKILAGEVRKPGSFSLRTLQFVSTLSREDAHKISDFYSFVLVGNIAPLPDDVNAEKIPGFANRALIEELGLASSPNAVGGFSMNYVIGPRSKLPLKGSTIAIVVENDTDKELKLSVPCQILTRPGQELAAIANPPATPTEYAVAVAQKLFAQVRGSMRDEVEAGTVKVTVVRVIPVMNGWRFGEILHTASKPT